MILNPNCSELILRLGGFSKEQIIEELKKIGINEIEIPKELEDFRINYETNNMLADKYNPNLPDFSGNAILYFIQGKEALKEFGENLIIEGSLDCNYHIFPTMARIIEHLQKEFPDFTNEWIGYDGGSTKTYDEWIKKDKPER